MTSRRLAMFVVFAFALAASSRAQESPTSDAGRPASSSAPDAVKPASSATPDAGKPASPSTKPTSKSAKKAKSKSSSRTTPGSPGDKPDDSATQSAQQPKSEQATFGAGCFWHVEAVFEQLKGVNSAVSGYAGGGVPNPTYEMVHEGNTGHAEVVLVDYDPDAITYEELLKVFWSNHDPTSINRQGEDEGPQYRSVIMYHNEAQRKAALKSYQALTEKRVFRSPIVTQLVPMVAFYPAEYYHQDFYGGKPRAGTRRKKTTVSKAKKAQTKAAKSASPAREPIADPAEASPNPVP